MSEPRTVLFVDGPARGEVRTLAPGQPPLVRQAGSEIRYVIHRFRLCGHVLRLASIHTRGQDVDEEDIFDAVCSPGARLADIPLREQAAS